MAVAPVTNWALQYRRFRHTCPKRCQRVPLLSLPLQVAARQRIDRCRWRQEHADSAALGILALLMLARRRQSFKLSRGHAVIMLSGLWMVPCACLHKGRRTRFPSANSGFEPPLERTALPFA